MAAKTSARTSTPSPIHSELPRLRKPDWPKGLRLMPQHYAAQDRYHEELIALTLRLTMDRPWGVADVAIDADAIDSGEFSIHRLSAILPDGTPLVVGNGGVESLTRSFEASLRSRSSVDVYVGILRDVPGRGPVELAGGDSAPSRFIGETSTIAEYDRGENPVVVPWSRPNIRILFEDEQLEPYSALRIARIERGEGGRATLDARFVPPVLRVRASPHLEHLLRTLEKAFHATRAAITPQRREAGEATMSDATRLLLSMMLGRMLPRVSDSLGSNAHPREAYRLLAELVGALSPLTPSGVAVIPPFNYLELGGTFEELATHAQDILATIVAPAFRSVPIRRYDHILWVAELREPGMFGKEFVLVVTSGDPAAVRAQFALHARVAAWEDIGALISASVPGIGVVAESRRPAGLALPAQSVSFRLHQHGPEWDSLVRKGTLALYAPPPFNQAQVSLFVKDRSVLT